MKIRQADINGTMGWCLDYGKRDGKRRRRYFTTEDEAKDALKDAEKEVVAVGRRWAHLAPERRADVVTILKEIETAGLTLRTVWDGFRDGSNSTVEEIKSLGDAITELVKAKTAANRRP